MSDSMSSVQATLQHKIAINLLNWYTNIIQRIQHQLQAICNTIARPMCLISFWLLRNNGPNAKLLNYHKRSVLFVVDTLTPAVSEIHPMTPRQGQKYHFLGHQA